VALAVNQRQQNLKDDRLERKKVVRVAART
jgi:hypothetical protein